DDELRETAMHLLKCLTKVHTAEDSKALMIRDTESNPHAADILDVVFQRYSHVKIQAADVAITRQWQLSSKLVSGAHTTATTRLDMEAIVQGMGLAAMSSVCLLGEGELRIVGLGKLAALARNIYALTGPGKCDYVLGGLAGAVMKGDYEKFFAPT